jgi:protein-tyrosine phosphatase
VSDPKRTTREPDYKESDVELELFEHYIPVEELENNQEVVLRIPEPDEIDPDIPF